MNPFIPGGYLPTEVAVAIIAEVRSPDTWLRIPAAESRVWKSDLQPNLRFLVEYLKDPTISDDERSKALARWRSYIAAAIELQRLLFAAVLRIYFLNEERQLEYILANEWAGGEWQLNTLICGIDAVPCDIGHVYGQRRLFIFAPDLHSVVQTLRREPRPGADQALLDAPEGSGRSLKTAEAYLRSQPQDQAWPPLSKHWAEVKMLPNCHNVRRAEVDGLRKQIAGGLLPRPGRPKKSPERNSPKNNSPEN